MVQWRTSVRSGAGLGDPGGLCHGSVVILCNVLHEGGTRKTWHFAATLYHSVFNRTQNSLFI